METKKRKPRKLETRPRLPTWFPKIPRSMARIIELRLKADAACAAMPDMDKERLRVEPNSERIARLEAAYSLAQRDKKRRLCKEPLLNAPQERTVHQRSIWGLLCELAALAKNPRQLKGIVSILIHNQKLRSRGKGQKTCPEVKALFDHLTREGFLCYDKKTRLYRLAPCYGGAVRLMRAMEQDVLCQLFSTRPAVRER